MILEYKVETKIKVIKGCQHIENGIIRNDNLMVTEYTPINFIGTTKTYFLRDGHELWKTQHIKAEKDIHKEWLKELGYDSEGYEVDFSTHEIKAKQNPHWNPDYHKSTGAVEKDREVDSI